MAEQTKLRLYDVSLDEVREPTQLDLDQFQIIVLAYGRLRSEVKRLAAGSAHTTILQAVEANYAEVMRDIENCKKQPGEAADGPSYQRGWDDALAAVKKNLDEKFSIPSKVERYK